MDHAYHDRVSLEIGRWIAAGLPAHPEWVVQARDNLDRWSERNRDSPRLLRSYDEWREILGRAVAEICRVLTDTTDEGQRLRQSSPFAGVSPREVVDEIKRMARDGQS